MNPQQILLQRLSFVLDPVEQLPMQARKLTSIHHDAVMKFRLAATSLTQPGTDLLRGEAAKAFDAIMNEYLRSEALFTGAGTVAKTGGMEEAAVACEMLQQDIVRAILLAFVEHSVLDWARDKLFEVVAAIDFSAALQGFIDIPDDAAAAILTGIEATIELTLFLFEVKNFLEDIYQAVQRWQYKIQGLADQPLPSLPPTPFTVSKTVLI